MHGVGIRAMGRLMDRVMYTMDPTAEDAGRDESSTNCRSIV